MRIFKFSMIALALGAMVALAPVAAPKAQAQVSIGIGVGGAAPACPYGYYDYRPYRCAPYGYYGSEWFTNGAFIGTGPWYHGDRRFYGHVNHAYDPRYGYHGAYPGHEEHFDTHRDFHDFHASHVRSPRGRERRR